jgi:hypothetical protein
MNVLLPGYNIFEKWFADAELLTVFVNGLIWLFPFWGIPTLEVTARGFESFLKTFYRAWYMRCCPFR